jgi:pyruvate dehydrogenase E2 component (dihydrolipoamide acetyltransferase)
MAIEVRVPVRGEGMEECVISEWYANRGDAVTAGQPLLAIETAKAVYDIEAPADGVLLDIRAEAGAEAAVHQVVGVIGEPDEVRSAMESAGVPSVDAHDPGALLPTSASPAVASNGPSTSRPTGGGRGTPGSRASDRIAISPRARVVIERSGLDPATIRGTGPGGRIIISDVQRARAEQLPAGADGRKPTSWTSTPARAAAPDTDAPDTSAPGISAPTPTTVHAAQPLSATRAVIAARMSEAAAIPTVTLHRAADAAALRAVLARRAERAERWTLPPATVTDYVHFVVSRVLPRNPALNAWLTADGVVRHAAVHLGVAVDTDRGLMVPVIRDAHTRSVSALAVASRELAGRARNRAVTAAEMTGATFTVTNLGAWGVGHFTPLLNPPGVAILGVGAIAPGIVPGGQIGELMPLSLTFDHRAADGADAARLLADIADGLRDLDILLGN